MLVQAENPADGQDLELVGEVVAVDLMDFIALPNAQLLGQERGPGGADGLRAARRRPGRALLAGRGDERRGLTPQLT